MPNPVDKNTLDLFNQVSQQNPAAGEALRQYGITSESLQPYIQAGASILPAMNTMNGLGGDINPIVSGITNSDYYRTQQSQGLDTILQNASAGGKVGGGNTQTEIAQYSPQLLNQLLQEKYGQLGALFNLGQGSAAGLSGIATGTGANVSGALASAGNLNAQRAIQRGQNTANTWGTIAGLGGLATKLF